MSFPPGTEMFQFSGFASPKLCIHFGDILPIKPRPRLAPGLGFDGEDGFPHSEICGSKVAHTSPQLIAACHVLHRLCMPRHPRIALTSRLRIHTTNDRTGTRCRWSCRALSQGLAGLVRHPSRSGSLRSTTQLDKDYRRRHALHLPAGQARPIDRSPCLHGIDF